jgi:hypothetical protein
MCQIVDTIAGHEYWARNRRHPPEGYSFRACSRALHLRRNRLLWRSSPLNILDFATADPADYFRVSDCAAVVEGVRKLGTAVQEHLVDSFQG